MWNNLRLISSRPAYRTVGLMFLLNSLMFTFWVTRVPEIKDRLLLSEGELGMVLFFAPLGGITAMFLANFFTSRWGEGRVTVWAMLLAGIAMLGPTVAPSVPLLAVGLYFMGFFGAVMNVAMNAVVTLLEKRDKTHFMITCHGGWSLGGLIGATSTSLLLGAGVSPWLHWSILFGFMLMWGIMVARPTLSSIAMGGPAGPALQLPSRPLLGLAAIGLCVMIGEGAAADWSGVYLRDVVHASDYLIGLGYASFTLFMTLGRFYGDGLTARFGGVKIIRVGTAIAILGLVLVLIPTVFTTLVGFGLTGLGYSAVVPVLFSRSGQVAGLPPSVGIASVASAGYVGFLGGPVLIGFMAEEFGLGSGFVLVLILTLGAFLFTPRAMAIKTA